MISILVGAGLSYVLGKNFSEATNEELRCKSWLQIEDPLSEHSKAENRHNYSQKLISLKNRKNFVLAIFFVLSFSPCLFSIASLFSMAENVNGQMIGTVLIHGIVTIALNSAVFCWSFYQHKMAAW